jgi:hypothetical protein
VVDEKNCESIRQASESIRLKLREYLRLTLGSEYRDPPGLDGGEQEDLTLNQLEESEDDDDVVL